MKKNVAFTIFLIVFNSFFLSSCFERAAGKTISKIMSIGKEKNNSLLVQFGKKNTPSTVTIGYKTMITTSKYDDYISEIALNGDETYAIGTTSGHLFKSSLGGKDIFLTKFDKDMDLIWAKQNGEKSKISLSSSKNDNSIGMEIDSNNLYILKTTEERSFQKKNDLQEIHILISNLDGFIEVDFNVNENYPAIFKNRKVRNIKFKVTKKRIYISALVTFSNNKSNLVIIALTKKLKPLWSYKYNNKKILKNNDAIKIFNIATDNDTNIYIAGSTTEKMTEELGGKSDIFITKISSIGKLLWVKQFGKKTLKSKSDKDEGHFGGILYNDSSIYITGTTTGSLGNLNGGLEDVFLMKLDLNGSIVWISQLGEYELNGRANAPDFVHSIAADQENNIYLAGRTMGAIADINIGEDDIFVSKVGPNGMILKTIQLGKKILGDKTLGKDTPSSIKIDKNNNVYIGGSSTGDLGDTNGGQRDAIVIKLSSNIFISQ